MFSLSSQKMESLSIYVRKFTFKNQICLNVANVQYLCADYDLTKKIYRCECEQTRM